MTDILRRQRFNLSSSQLFEDEKADVIKNVWRVAELRSAVVLQDDAYRKTAIQQTVYGQSGRTFRSRKLPRALLVDRSKRVKGHPTISDVIFTTFRRQR